MKQMDWSPEVPVRCISHLPLGKTHWVFFLLLNPCIPDDGLQLEKKQIIWSLIRTAQNAEKLTLANA